MTEDDSLLLDPSLSETGLETALSLMVTLLDTGCAATVDAGLFTSIPEEPDRTILEFGLIETIFLLEEEVDLSTSDCKEGRLLEVLVSFMTLLGEGEETGGAGVEVAENWVRMGLPAVGGELIEEGV